MSNVIRPSMLRAPPPLHLDSTAIKGRSLDISPSRSSVHSSSSQSQAHTPSSSVSDTPLLPTRPPSPEKRPPHPANSISFLTALAAQERRVLELREELQKADEDLEKLKKQWAVHEAAKKKNELRHLQQLQPLNTAPLGSSMPSDDDSASAIRELDRRRITPSGIKPSYRKIFAGSRHTQALSLLSRREPGSHSDLLSRGNEPSKPHQAAANNVAVPTTVPEISSVDVESGSDDSYRGPHKDVILDTGKQLVGDFRHGLWAFFEDFKQLTIGDEGIGTAGVHNPPVIASKNTPRRQSMNEKRTATTEIPARKAGASDAVRESLGKPQTQVSLSRQRVGSSFGRPTEATSTPTCFISEGADNANSSDSDEDGWDNWDIPKESTPRRKYLVDGAEPMASPLTDRSSPRTSMR